MVNPLNDISRNSQFVMAGLSHRNTPLEIREKFNLTAERISLILKSARTFNINSILPVSTCNRVELYSSGAQASALARILCEVTGNDLALFDKYGYLMSGEPVIDHIFRVCSGLESKVKGDAQITGQVAEALQRSVFHNAIRAPLIRLAESAISTGKKIKTEVQITNSAPSVAESAVNMTVSMHLNNRLIMEPKSTTPFKKYENRKINISDEKNYLVIGLGKMGQLILDILLRNIHQQHIAVINRSSEILQRVETGKGVRVSGFDSLKHEVDRADIIFVATAASGPILKPYHVQQPLLKPKVFIDLCLPRNIDPEIGDITGTRLIDLDHIDSSSETILNNYFLKAEQLVRSGISEFLDWLNRFRFAQELKAELNNSIFFNGLDENSDSGSSKFIENLTGKHIKYLQKAR